MATLRTAVIKKCREQDLDDRPESKQRWCLYTHDGKKLLGRHPTEEAAKKQERAIQVHKHGETTPSIVKYKGAYYRPVEALQQEIRPDKRLPVGTDINEYVSSKIQLTQINMALQRAEKVFDALVASPGMEKYDDKRQEIDKYLTGARKALQAVESLTERMGDKIENQSETIKRFQNALKELQTQRAAGVQRISEKMATENKAPEMVKYAGHFYVLAEDDKEKEPDEEKEEGMEEEPKGEEAEEAEEIELLDALKGHWQTILDKLPDDLAVDDEFEAALNGVDEVIGVMNKIHEEYAAEMAGEEEEEEEEEGPEEEPEGE